MGGGTGTGGDPALEVLQFPDINPSDDEAIDQYHEYAYHRAFKNKEYVAIQRNFDSDAQKELAVYNNGRFIGSIIQKDTECDVYVYDFLQSLERTEPKTLLVGRQSVPFEVAARLMHMHVMGEFIEDQLFAAIPNNYVVDLDL